MATTDSKLQLLAYVQSKTPQVLWGRLSELSAADIAAQLGTSRTLASQYLNEGVAEGLLVKINSRPVCFLHRESLAGPEAGSTLDESYPSAEALRRAAGGTKRPSVFEKLTGHSGSLSYTVEQCKAAMAYPSGGLPILLHGPTGTGKSYVARLMYEYGVEKGILAPNSQFVSLNCAEYANNPELLLTNLFGHKKGAYTGADQDRKGLITLADGGVLFLDEVHRLKGESQEKLFLFMDQGIYHVTGDNETWHSAKVRLVMATTENPELALLKTMLRRIPIITRLPPLSARPLQEKKELIYGLFSEEVRRVGREITVSSLVYDTLLDYDFIENVGQVVNCVRACSANALLDMDDAGADSREPLVIRIHNLPDYILRSHSIKLMAGSGAENAIYTLDQLREKQQSGQGLFLFNQDILAELQRRQQDGEEQDFFPAGRLRFEQYLDDMNLAERRQDNPREELYGDLIKSICENVGRKFGISFRRHDVLNLCRFMNDYAASGAASESLARKNRETVLAGMELYRTGAPQNYTIVQELAGMISGGLNLSIGHLGMLDLCICFDCFAARFDQRKTVGIILAHGYSTASSMAATANHLLGRQVFDAIDMPMEVHPSVIVQKLTAFLDTLGGVKDVVILVDMGSLQDIAQKLDNVEDMNLAVIGDVTIKLALRVGQMIETDSPIAAIVQRCTETPLLHEHVLLENRRRQAAILTVCATGIATAERIAELFTKSFPHTIDAAVLPYNFGSLQAAGDKSPVFEKYNVLFIVGTDDPGIPGYPFFSLEDMLEQRNTSEINGLLSAFFDPTAMRQFNSDLVKQFSLQNLLDHLTILNPDKIIGNVEAIIQLLQQKTGLRFRNATIVGLYIHISCLIERLITDRYIVNYENLEAFQRDHADFIAMAQDCFSDIKREYGVGLPDSEAGYLYEYIYRL